MFNFDFQNSKLIFKMFKNEKTEIETYVPRGKQLKELLKIQGLTGKKNKSQLRYLLVTNMCGLLLMNHF